jgi:hypothetical protein
MAKVSQLLRVSEVGAIMHSDLELLPKHPPLLSNVGTSTPLASEEEVEVEWRR